MKPDFTPYIPSDRTLASSGLPDAATQLATVSAQLAGQLAPVTQLIMVEHMSVINSYYSNLIEGNKTLPHEIRAAQAGEFSGDPAKRDLQLESLAHIHVQQWLNEQQPDLDTLYSPDFIQQIHSEFYEHVPASLLELRDGEGKVVDTVIPGQWRKRDVRVGEHIAPDEADIASLMKTFCDVYHPAKYKGDRKVIAVMCAHHRLAWIHPFADGNGRVMRLFTDAALKAIGMESNGVWCLSRGLARASENYKTVLARADHSRQGDYDGRGVLSEKTLVEFCAFMLKTAIDQVEYMKGLLNLDKMHQRIHTYIQARNDGRVLGMGKLKENTELVLFNAFLRGEVPRALAISSLGMSERSARRLLAQLKEDQLLSETSTRSDLRWEIPEHAEPWYFPLLTPTI